MENMTRLGFVFASLAACTYPTDDSVARFHGSVGNGVTHVMAVSPIAGDVQKVVAPVEFGGFSISVDPGRPWAMVFVDSTRVGSQMVNGVLRSDTLDTFLPEQGGDVDLGDISIDGRDATMAGSSEALDSALGLSRRTLATIGGLDDIALRYANPDVDGDGVIDVEQNRAARLEMLVEYGLTAAGRKAVPDDFIVRADRMGYDHLGTGIYGRLPDTFGEVDREHASVTFDQPFYGFAAGPFTAPIKPGEPVTELTYGDSRTFGVFARPDHPVPSGDYRFQSGGQSLEFTLVRPPTEMIMHQVMPRIRFVPVVPGCEQACAVASIEFRWARNTEAGWVTLTDEETHAMQPVGTIDILSTTGARRYELPVGVATGSVPWQLDIYRADPITTADMTYINVGFQLRPGMKMYASLGDGHAAPHQFAIPDFGDATR